jgi:hypothetical protein
MNNARYTRPSALRVASSDFDWLSDDIRVLLVSNTATFDPTAEFVADIVADEVTNDTGTGYERKVIGSKTRAIVQNVAVTGVTVNKDVVRMSGANLTYSNINTNERIGGGYIFRQVTDDSDSLIVASFIVPDIPSDVISLPEVVITPDSNLGYTFFAIL